MGSGFVVAVLGSCHFYETLQILVTFLKTLHRKTPLGQADARNKAKTIPEFQWCGSSLLSACSFKNGGNSGHLSVPTVAISVYQHSSSQRKDSGHLRVKVVSFLNSFYVQRWRIVRHSQKSLSHKNIYRVPLIFDSSRVITPTTGPMAKPQPTVTRPLVHFGAGSHPLSYCTYGCCPSMNFGSP